MNVKIGNGQAVHAKKVEMGFTGGKCGAGLNFDGFTFRHRNRGNQAKLTDQPITCKRCLKMLAEATSGSAS